MPRFKDVPELETVLLDRKDLPSAGAGESSLVKVAPAIANAIFDATAKTGPATATTDYHALLNNASIDAIIISATPETTHFPMAKESMQAGKHVLGHTIFHHRRRAADRSAGLDISH